MVNAPERCQTSREREREREREQVWDIDSRAQPGFFSGGKTEGSKAESGAGIPRRGQHLPSHKLEGLGERCDLPRWASGRVLDRQKTFHYFQHSGWPLQTLTIVLLIVGYLAAIGEPRLPCPPPLRTPLPSEKADVAWQFVVVSTGAVTTTVSTVV